MANQRITMNQTHRLLDRSENPKTRLDKKLKALSRKSEKWVVSV